MRKKPDVVLVFGENDNDRRALIEIARALTPHATVNFERRSKPLVLLSPNEKVATVRSTASDIEKLVKIARVRFNVVAIIAHRDCDAVEPAHLTVSAFIRQGLSGVGVSHVIPAAPAFELEAWWLLFPEAVQAVCPSWRTFSYDGQNVGMIADAKEYLARLVRPTDAKKRVRCPEYSESDGIRIAERIRELGIARRVLPHQCGSFISFIAAVDHAFPKPDTAAT